MRLLLLKSWRDLHARRWQAVGIALLVATVVTATAGGNRARRMIEYTQADTCRELVAADLEIHCSPVLPGVLERARAIEGIEAAEARMLMEGVLRADGATPLRTIVRVLPESPPAINKLKILEGRYPRAGELGVVLDRSVPRTLPVGVGDWIELEIAGRASRLPVLGISLSPDHLLYPSNPDYLVPLPGTLGVAGVSAGAAKAFEHTHLVDSLLFTFAPHADAAALPTRLIESLGVAPMAVVPREESVTTRNIAVIVRFFDIYVPTGLFVLLIVALTLLVLTLHRTIERQSRQIGVLAALGYTRGRLAAAYLTLPVLASVAGALLGAAAHGVYARFIYASYAAGLGLPPLRDPGPGLDLFVVMSTCVVLAAALAFTIAMVTASRQPGRNMRPAPRRPRILPSVGRLLANMRRALPLPFAAVLGATYLSRRRWSSTATVICLGLNIALVVACIFVHATHAEATTRSIGRFGLDATANLLRPLNDEELLGIAQHVDGEAQPMITAHLVVQRSDRVAFLRVVCLEPSGWIERLHCVRGRALENPTAPELVLDEFLARTHGVDVGDRLTCYPAYNAPEGIELTVVGILGGVSLGHASIPLEVGRDLLRLPGLCTAVTVASELPAAELEERLRALPDVESVQSVARARERAGDALAGLERILILAVLMAAVVAVLFLALLATLDSTDRAPDLAVLRAMGWRDRSLFLVGATEVVTRGALAFLVSIPAAPLIADWLLGRLQSANGYRLTLETPAWVILGTGAVFALLLPLGALPAWRAARRTSPGAAVRSLVAE